MKRNVLIGIIVILNVVLCVSVLLFVRLVTNGGIRLGRKLDLGNKYLLSMEYDKALRAFTEAIDIDPMAEDAYTGRGDTYLALGDYENAWKDYEKVREINGDNSLFENRFGRTEVLVTDVSGTPLSDADITISNESHHYRTQTDSNGIASEVICPADYHLSVRKDDYIDAEQNVKIDYQQRTIDTIVMEPSDPNAGALEALNAFAGQYSYMYGNSYSVSGRISGGFIVRDYENLSSEAYMGYAIEDFDNDGYSELCIAKLEDHETLIIIMYEYVEANVVEQSRITVEDTNLDPSFASENVGGWDALMSIFTTVIDDRTNIIVDKFALASYFADGLNRFITRLTYDGSSFYVSASMRDSGSDWAPEDVQHYLNQMRALGMGNPDHSALVEHAGAYAYDYFDNASEFVHDEFYTESRTNRTDWSNKSASGTWYCKNREEMHQG